MKAAKPKGNVRRGGRRRSIGRSQSRRSSARIAPGVSRALIRLGRRIQMLRIERGLSQGMAAEMAMLDAKHLQEIESASTNPTVATLVGIARALGVPLPELFRLTPRR